jgi:hypothetical protein
MNIELSEVNLFYIIVFLVWWSIGYFFDGQSRSSGYMGETPSDRTCMRFLLFWPVLIMSLIVHLVAFK